MTHDRGGNKKRRKKRRKERKKRREKEIAYFMDFFHFPFSSHNCSNRIEPENENRSVFYVTGLSLSLFLLHKQSLLPWRGRGRERRKRGREKERKRKRKEKCRN